MRVCVLFSGTGSNLKNILENQRRNSLDVVRTITDNYQAGGLAYAHAWGVPTLVLPSRKPMTLDEWENLIMNDLSDQSIELVVLAGFMRVLSPRYCFYFGNQTINIHPSLLPKYPGLNTHQRVLSSKETKHGCTIHFISEEVDAGPIIAQEEFTFDPEKETKESLRKKVQQKEHQLYPKVIQAICDYKIIYADYAKNKITFNGKDLHHPLSLKEFK